MYQEDLEGFELIDVNQWTLCATYYNRKTREFILMDWDMKIIFRGKVLDKDE